MTQIFVKTLAILQAVFWKSKQPQLPHQFFAGQKYTDKCQKFIGKFRSNG
jgi:hypothetical protein